MLSHSIITHCAVFWHLINFQLMDLLVKTALSDDYCLTSTWSKHTHTNSTTVLKSEHLVKQGFRSTKTVAVKFLSLLSTSVISHFKCQCSYTLTCITVYFVRWLSNHKIVKILYKHCLYTGHAWVTSLFWLVKHVKICLMISCCKSEYVQYVGNVVKWVLG